MAGEVSPPQPMFPSSSTPRLRDLRRLSRAMVVALACGLGAAVLVALALGDSAPWAVKIPVAMVGGGTIGLIGAGYAVAGTENDEEG
jgi:hypothetical protein